MPGLIRFSALTIIVVALCLGQVGCTKQNSASSSSIAWQGQDNKMSSRRASLKLGEKEPLPRTPMLSSQDAAEMGRILDEYFDAVIKDDKAAAVKCFLPDTQRTAEDLFAKDQEKSREYGADYRPKESRIVWYQNGKIWLKGGVDLLRDSDIERLLALSKTHDKAAIIVAKAESGALRRVPVVHFDGAFFLVPDTKNF